MKNFLVILLLAAVSCNGPAKDKQAGNASITSLVNNPHTANGLDTVSAAMKPVMVFKDTVHDFGNIKQGEVVSYEFSFTNTGKTPLIITNALGSCGCTVPDYPKNAVAPGESSILKVTFSSAGKSGPQLKSVSIRTNTLRSTEMLYIKAVVDAKDGDKGAQKM